MLLQTEFDFELPRGYVDDNGRVHRAGRIRLATAADELIPLRDVRAKENPEYIIILILSRVITQLGDYDKVTEKMVERFFVQDLSYLQDLYNRINQGESPCYDGACPECGKKVRIPINFHQAGQW